jgi:hypothetical protein
MFSTVLTEITGYFGKPFLVSVFFPSLFFWMLNLALGVLAVELTDVLSWWQDLEGQVQGFLAVAFLILVLLTAYILHIFMRALTRFYKGDWSFLQFIPRAMQKRNEEMWKKLRTQNEELGASIQALKSRQETFERLLDRDEPPLPYGTRVNVPVMAQEAAALYDQVRDWTVADYLNDEKWKAMEEQLSSLQARILALSADELDQHQADVGPGSKADLVFRAPYEFLENLIGQLEQEQLAFHWEWSVAFPERLSWVMPTRLGNHIRAAATYSFRRYNLDAAIIWPRLQETLPDKFAERLDEAKMNMDLMLVLTTLALVFGVVWGGTLVVVPDAWLAMRKWVVASIVFLAGIGVARVAYLNAAESALSYGELYKTAFDLYRWDALKALHFDLPPDLESEKKLWGEISGLFYRNYPLKTPWKH